MDKLSGPKAIRMPKKNPRKKLLKSIKRAVVKVGSGVLTEKNGLNLDVIDHLVLDICSLLKKEIEIIVVSSGAIASGMKKIGLKKRPNSISQQQALEIGRAHV